eukprot:SAG11_NODE_775_length_7226_cov_2.988214_2_plen_98_part_00
MQVLAEVELAELVLYIVRLMDGEISGGYTLLYIHTLATAENVPSVHCTFETVLILNEMFCLSRLRDKFVPAGAKEVYDVLPRKCAPAYIVAESEPKT